MRVSVLLHKWKEKKTSLDFPHNDSRRGMGAAQPSSGNQSCTNPHALFCSAQAASATMQRIRAVVETVVTLCGVAGTVIGILNLIQTELQDGKCLRDYDSKDVCDTWVLHCVWRDSIGPIPGQCRSNITSVNNTALIGILAIAFILMCALMLSVLRAPFWIMPARPNRATCWTALKRHWPSFAGALFAGSTLMMTIVAIVNEVVTDDLLMHS